MSFRVVGLVALNAAAILVLALDLSIRAGADELGFQPPPVVTPTAPSAPPVAAPAPPEGVGDATTPPPPQADSPALPAVQVEPPTWVEIPPDLVATPTPVEPTPVPLPMLTSIPSSPRDGSVVYLTFDDGPNPTATHQILDLLARYDAKATFFVLGSAVDTHPDLTARIVAEGHGIGNHTYGHEALPLETPERVLETLAATQGAIQRATGRGTSCMRPPYGSLDQRTYDLVRNAGYSVAMWEVDSDDWKLGDGYQIAANVLGATDLGDRVLLHDGPTGRATTVAAVESILQVLTTRGVQFHALLC